MFPFFNHYPGTDLHEIDLAYILKLCAELQASNTTLTEWKATHEQEYADLANKVEGLINNLVDVISPWDSSIAYHIYSIVEYQGNNYIAIQDVPVGTMITNTEYWQLANTALEQINAIGVITSDLQTVSLRGYANVQSMISDTALDPGMITRTLGYYAESDGGAALYIITNTAPDTYYETLTNGNFAQLIIIDNYVKVEQFGAYGDETHDDSAAIQNAINSGYNVGLLADKGYYCGSNTLTISTDFQKLFGIETSEIKRARILVSNDSWGANDPFLTITGKQNTIDGISFEGVGTKGYAIHADHGDNNTDLTVTNSRFEHWYGAVYSKGRGPCIERSIVTSAKLGFYLENYTDAQTDPFTSVAYGGRGTRIRFNRLQALSSGTACYAVTFGNGNFIGSIIEGNLVESRAGLINHTATGLLRDLLVTNNVVIAANNNDNMITILNNTDCVISNNILMGIMYPEEYAATGDTATMSQTMPVKMIYVNGTTSGLVITGNQFENCSGYGIDLRLDCSVTITGNRFKNIGDYAIFVRAKGILEIDNNICEITESTLTNKFFRIQAASEIYGKVFCPVNADFNISAQAWIDIMTNKAFTAAYRTTIGLNGHIASNNGYDVSDRANSTAYSANTKAKVGNYVYTCITAGTSAASAPTFSTTPGSTTVDGSVTWKCVSYAASVIA